MLVYELDEDQFAYFKEYISLYDELAEYYFSTARAPYRMQFANYGEYWDWNDEVELFMEIGEYMNRLSISEEEPFIVFLDWAGEDFYYNFRDCWEGTYEDELDFAKCLVRDVFDDSYMNEYFNYQKYADDLFEHDFVFVNGCVFRYI